MPDQVEKLIEKLCSSDRDIVKSSIIEELGKIGDHRAIRPLIESLNDGDALVRWNAIQAIALFGSDSLGQLFKALESSDRFIRRNVVQALGEVGGEETVDRLIRMLMFDEPDQGVLIEVIRALHKLRPAHAVDPLLTVLKMNDWEMKWRAINTLGHIGDPRAIEPLLAVMEDDDPDIRWAASIAVENIKKRSMEREVDPAGMMKSAIPVPVASGRASKARPASEISLLSHKKPGWVVIKVAGDIISTSAGAFRSYVDGIISVTGASIEIDLTECDFIDSFALSQFNMVRKKLKSKNRSLKLTGMNPNLKHTFEATKLDELFVIED